MVNTKQLTARINGYIKGYKTSANNLQQILIDFIDSFNAEDGLNKNSTPLSNLLKGLRKTDAELVKAYIKKVTNAQVYLNGKGNYTLKIEGDELTTNENYAETKWFDLAEKAVVIVKDYYKNIDEALKATDKTLVKAINTIKTAEEKKQLLDAISERLATITIK